MKKILSLLFIFSLMLGIVALSACGETTVTTTQTEAVATTATGNSSIAKTDFEYSVNRDGTLTITKYIGTEKNVAMPSGIDGKAVTKIGEYAFTGCDGVESVTMPPTVNGINKKAFFNAARLKNINVSEENATFTSIDGVLFRTEKTKLLCYPMGRTEDNYEIPSGVVEIGEDAFENVTSLKNVEFSRDVKEIAAHAFVDCALLESVTLYRSVASIEDDAFVGCSENFSIRGYKGSFAEEYALGNGLKFVPFSTVVIDGDRAPDEPIPDVLLYELEEYYNANPNLGIIYVYNNAYGAIRPYYGIYDGYVVFMVEGMLPMVYDVTIGGEQFYHHQLITIVAYKDGTFTRLEDLYAEGKISDEAIKKIAAYHREFNDIEYYMIHDFRTSISNGLKVPAFDDETIGKIKAAWSDEERTPEHIIPYGKYGDCYVFALDRSLKYYTDRTFGDCVFRAYNPNAIYVYTGGEIMTLDAAFDGGYIGENEICTVMAYNADWLYVHKIFKNPNFE